MADTPLLIGWKDYADLPDLGIQKVKVKVDSGARTSTLHIRACRVLEVLPDTRRLIEACSAQGVDVAVLDPLEAPFGGLALGLTQLPLVHPGDPVCHIARLEAHQLEAWSIFWESGRIRL